MSVSSTEQVRCPYNPAHVMKRNRFQAHIMKCRVQYPEIKLKTCPLNLTHLVKEEDYFKHVNSCPDRKIIEEYKFDVQPKKEERIKHEPIESEENWDDTVVQDYNPQVAAAAAKVLRAPQGYCKSQRKQFLREERERLGDVVDLPEDDDGTKNNHFSLDGRPPTPPPPKWYSSSEEDGEEEEEKVEESDTDNWKNKVASFLSEPSRSPQRKSKRPRSRSPHSRGHRYEGGDRRVGDNSRDRHMYGDDYIRGRARGRGRGPGRSSYTRTSDFHGNDERRF